MCRCGGSSEHQHLEVTFQTDLHSNISFIDADKAEGNVQHVVRKHYKQIPDMFDPLQSKTGLFLICLYMKEPVRIAGIVLEVDGIHSFDVFVNPKVSDPDHIVFEDISALKSVQQFLVSTEPLTLTEYQTRVALYNKVKTLVLCFHCHSSSMIKFLALTGQLSMQPAKAVNATYELRPQLVDHHEHKTLYSSSMNRELR